MHGVLRLLFLRKLEHDRAGHVVPGAVGGVDERGCDRRHIPGKGEERKKSRLAAGHGPSSKCLIANANARFCPRTGDVEGRQIRHAQVKVVLIWIDTEYRWSRH